MRHQHRPRLSDFRKRKRPWNKVKGDSLRAKIPRSTELAQAGHGFGQSCVSRHQHRRVMEALRKRELPLSKLAPYLQLQSQQVEKLQRISYPEESHVLAKLLA